MGYGESTVLLATVKSSKKELETKEKATDDAKQAVDKARAAGKKLGKLESKEDKCMNALSVATECYEYQLKLTNERVFEAFNDQLPAQLQRFESLKLSGIKHYTMVIKQVAELLKKLPKNLKKISGELQTVC